LFLFYSLFTETIFKYRNINYLTLFSSSSDPSALDLLTMRKQFR